MNPKLPWLGFLSNVFQQLGTIQRIYHQYCNYENYYPNYWKQGSRISVRNALFTHRPGESGIPLTLVERHTKQFQNTDKVPDRMMVTVSTVFLTLQTLIFSYKNEKRVSNIWMTQQGQSRTSFSNSYKNALICVCYLLIYIYCKWLFSVSLSSKLLHHPVAHGFNYDNRNKNQVIHSMFTITRRERSFRTGCIFKSNALFHKHEFLYLLCLHLSEWQMLVHFSVLVMVSIS